MTNAKEAKFNADLNKFYAEYGQDFKTKLTAVNSLKNKGYTTEDGSVFKDSKGKRAFLTRLRDARLNGREVVGYYSTGWLVTYELPYRPISFLDLQFAERPKE